MPVTDERNDRLARQGLVVYGFVNGTLLLPNFDRFSVRIGVALWLLCFHDGVGISLLHVKRDVAKRKLCLLPWQTARRWYVLYGRFLHESSLLPR